MKSGLLPLTGLWLSKDGKTMSANLGGLRVVVLKNIYKKEANHPDFVVCIAEKQTLEERTAKSEAKTETASATFPS